MITFIAMIIIIGVIGIIILMTHIIFLDGNQLDIAYIYCKGRLELYSNSAIGMG